ncbi:hypothetical protein ACWIGX_19990 [Streptomyces nigrescens]
MTSTTPQPETFVLASCTRGKKRTLSPVPALELYEEGIAPQLRERLGDHPDLRGRLYFLSGRHGLVSADAPLLPYDQMLTYERAQQLRPLVHRRLRQLLAGLVRPQLLVVVEPLYMVLLADVLADDDRPIVRWIPDPFGWRETAAVLDDWNWP